MKAKVLSIFNDYYTIKEFLFKYDFIDETQLNDDEYDLFEDIINKIEELEAKNETYFVTLICD